MTPILNVLRCIACHMTSQPQLSLAEQLWLSSQGKRHMMNKRMVPHGQVAPRGSTWCRNQTLTRWMCSTWHLYCLDCCWIGSTSVIRECHSKPSFAPMVVPLSLWLAPNRCIKDWVKKKDWIFSGTAVNCVSFVVSHGCLLLSQPVDRKPESRLFEMLRTYC